MMCLSRDLETIALHEREAIEASNMPRAEVRQQQGRYNNQKPSNNKAAPISVNTDTPSGRRVEHECRHLTVVLIKAFGENMLYILLEFAFVQLIVTETKSVESMKFFILIM